MYAEKEALFMYEDIKEQAASAMRELLDAACVPAGGLVVVGCSSSEIMGAKIGKGSTPEAAEAVIEGIMPLLKERGLYLAAQCCEHLNRALIIEREAAEKFVTTRSASSLSRRRAVPSPRPRGSTWRTRWRWSTCARTRAGHRLHDDRHAPA